MKLDIISANFLLISKKILTPKLKFEAYRKAPFFELQYETISSYLSSQPVVPEITGILASRARLILSTAVEGKLKSIATSVVEISKSVVLLVAFKEML